MGKESKQKVIYKNLIYFSLGWLVFLPISLVLHNLFSGIFGEISFPSGIFFLVAIILGLGVPIPIIIIIIFWGRLNKITKK